MGLFFAAGVTGIAGAVETAGCANGDSRIGQHNKFCKGRPIVCGLVATEPSADSLERQKKQDKETAQQDKGGKVDVKRALNCVPPSR